MNISVLGCGRWGSFIAWYLNKIGHNVTVWGRKESQNLSRFLKYRNNGIIFFDEKVKITSDLGKALSNCEAVVISISAQSLRDLFRYLSDFDLSNKKIILCMKGIEENTGKRLTQVACEYINKDFTDIAIWVGPGHVQDFLKGIPNCMVIDSDKKSVTKFLVDEFSSDLIRFYYGNDLIGNEIGAAAKNVIGIAAGILDGIGYESLKGALMSRGTFEISHLIQAMGGNPLSAYGLCHLGDYQATLFSEHSNNRQYGENIVKKQECLKLAEGVSTSRALKKLSEVYNVELPICNAVNAIIDKKTDPKTELSNLFLRPVKIELRRFPGEN
ncbi:MAG: glycerol-3-phosphate dehydrogenase [Oscillospiraceae bacterium]|jgi:glycerol-3-phosphate dehydrogenase (NAD(P)+)|nr:glycerol-3-phosphate dehydrogenase [Oscillospiraceae bacterium]